MICYIFPDQASAQAASNAIWSAIASTTIDKDAATGKDVGNITTAWAIPAQRVTDNQWWIPVCDPVPNSQNWTTDTFDVSWLPTMSETNL